LTDVSLTGFDGVISGVGFGLALLAREGSVSSFIGVLILAMISLRPSSSSEVA